MQFTNIFSSPSSPIHSSQGENESWSLLNSANITPLSSRPSTPPSLLFSKTTRSECSTPTNGEETLLGYTESSVLSQAWFFSDITGPSAYNEQIAELIDADARDRSFIYALSYISSAYACLQALKYDYYMEEMVENNATLQLPELKLPKPFLQYASAQGAFGVGRKQNCDIIGLSKCGSLLLHAINLIDGDGNFLPTRRDDQLYWRIQNSSVVFQQRQNPLTPTELSDPVMWKQLLRRLNLYANRKRLAYHEADILFTVPLNLKYPNYDKNASPVDSLDLHHANKPLTGQRLMASVGSVASQFAERVWYRAESTAYINASHAQQAAKHLPRKSVWNHMFTILQPWLLLLGVGNENKFEHLINNELFPPELPQWKESIRKVKNDHDLSPSNEFLTLDELLLAVYERLNSNPSSFLKLAEHFSIASSNEINGVGNIGQIAELNAAGNEVASVFPTTAEAVRAAIMLRTAQDNTKQRTCAYLPVEGQYRYDVKFSLNANESVKIILQDSLKRNKNEE